MATGAKVFFRGGIRREKLRNEGPYRFAAKIKRAAQGHRRAFHEAFKFDDLVKIPHIDGFVKSSPATGGTRRAKTEE